MSLTIIGEHPLAKDERGHLKSRIGTLFVFTGTLVTRAGVHGLQRLVYSEHLNAVRLAQGRPPLTPEEEEREWASGVDLIMADDQILIRPDHQQMPLALEADRLLQELEGVSKRMIRFLSVQHREVQQALRVRGEYWRIAPLPQTRGEIAELIGGSRIAIGCSPVYYYSATTGTRHLTLQDFAGLADLDDDALRQHLVEIRRFAGRRNRLGNPEMAFFAAPNPFADPAFRDLDIERGGADDLRAWHRAIVDWLRRTVPPDLWQDSLLNLPWRNRMFQSLTEQWNTSVAVDLLPELNPEFFLMVRWLPGGRIEEGELIFDPVFAELAREPNNPALRCLCDPTVKAFVGHYIREFGSLEYVNIGRIESGIRRRASAGGHRAYIAEVKYRGAPTPVVRILRIQQWGIREHLDEGKDLLQSFVESEEYTDYILDRRLGCWQLGMSLPPQIIPRRFAGTYDGMAHRYHDARIWTTYFERDYVRGVATDKILASRYRDNDFALRFARLLGAAAALDLVVGRLGQEGKTIFDRGDEILVLDDVGMPAGIVVADHAGTFRDYESDLALLAAGYAGPVWSRRNEVADLRAFAEAYLQAFAERLAAVQENYRRQRRAFDTLFQHTRQDKGAIAWRWKLVLARLDWAQPEALAAVIRKACQLDPPVP
jgi:hypothetical protein